METSPCHNSVAGHQIATNFCTCHDSTAVVPCTKFCSDHYIRIEVRVKRNFHRIWIAIEKPLVKRALFRFKICQNTIPLHWRHNGIDVVSNHQPCDCLLNRLFRRRSRKHQRSASLAFVRGIGRWPVNTPHNEPVTRKMFPYDDVSCNAHTNSQSNT